MVKELDISHRHSPAVSQLFWVFVPTRWDGSHWRTDAFPCRRGLCFSAAHPGTEDPLPSSVLHWLVFPGIHLGHPPLRTFHPCSSAACIAGESQGRGHLGPQSSDHLLEIVNSFFICCDSLCVTALTRSYSSPLNTEKSKLLLQIRPSFPPVTL